MYDDLKESNVIQVRAILEALCSFQISFRVQSKFCTFLYKAVVNNRSLGFSFGFEP